MDYWECIAHSQKGEERANHRYYAREQVGTTRLGFPKYRYFYDAREYGAYKTRQQQGKSENTRTKERGRTTFTIGEGKLLGKAPSYQKVGRSIEERDLLRANNARGKGYTQWGEQDGKFTDGLGLYSAKTVRDYKKPLRKAKQKLSGLLKNTSSSKESGMTGTSTRNMSTEARAAQVHKDAVANRRDRASTSVRAQKVQMDAKRYRKQKRERIKANRIAQQHTMDRERWKRTEKAEQAKNRGDKHNARVQEAIREKVHKDAVAYRRKRAQESVRAQKVAMDAKRYRKQRRQEKNDARNELKKKMDRDRIRTSIRAQKVKMDAKRYRRQKREMLKQKRAGQKRIMDNIRQRPYYQPTIKRGR